MVGIITTFELVLASLVVTVASGKRGPVIVLVVVTVPVKSPVEP